MAKYDGVLSRTPQVRQKSKIYTPKRDDQHPHPFICGVPPPPRKDDRKYVCCGYNPIRLKTGLTREHILPSASIQQLPVDPVDKRYKTKCPNFEASVMNRSVRISIMT